MKKNETRRCIMVLSNPFKPDYRVLKEAKSLVSNGYEITIIAWDRENKYPLYEEINGIKIERLKIKTPYGTGILKLNKAFLFWVEAIKRAKKKKALLIHCHDLDTLIVGVFLKIFYGIKVIYDAHENFPNMMTMSTPNIIIQIIRMYEIFLLNFVDSIIVASSVLGDEFKQKTNIPVSVIGNWHYPQQLDEYIVQDIRGRYIKNAKILITYIGSLDLSRALVPMIEAVKYQPDIQFLICGDGMQRKIVSELSAQIENVNYIGEIPLKMVPYFTAASDVIYYVLNEDSPIANYNAPNSLGFALITGKPMIASDMGDLGRVIRSTNCGILVKDSKVETLQEAILSSRQKNVRDELSRNALRVGKELYNWYHMEELLKKTYENIINV